MVQQVLSFARGVEGRRVQVQVAGVLRDVERIANDTFLKNIDVRTSIADDLWTVSGDPIQLHQVLLNLCVNARDAMPDGGTLLLSAENMTLDAAFAGANLDAQAGPHVDAAGAGHRRRHSGRHHRPDLRAVLHHQGREQGHRPRPLDLARHRQEPRRFHPGRQRARAGRDVFGLPAGADRRRRRSPSVAKPVELPRGQGELILVVDDEAPVRLVTQRMLEAFGYRVVAGGGRRRGGRDVRRAARTRSRR